MSVNRSSARPAFTSFRDSRTLSVPLAAVRIRRTRSGTSFPDPSVFARACASASTAESSSLVTSRELEIAAGRDGYLRAAMAQDVERGRADHRAVVGAESRTRHAEGMADASRDRLDDGTAGESEVEKPRDLVEGLACGVVNGPAERSKTAMRLHEDEIAVCAAHHEHDRGELGLRRNVLGLVQPVRVHVALEMVHSHERQTSREREAPRVVRTDQKATDEPGPHRRGDGVDLRELTARVAQRLLGEHIERTEVLACRDLRDDAPGILMDQLRRDDVRTGPPPILDDRDAGLIARRLDREDPQPVSCSSALSFAKRSRTGRSRSRSVHMISASSLLSE